MSTFEIYQRPPGQHRKSWSTQMAWSVLVCNDEESGRVLLRVGRWLGGKFAACYGHVPGPGRSGIAWAVKECRKTLRESLQ